LIHAATHMRNGSTTAALRSLVRVRGIMVLLQEQLSLLDTMAPKDYMTIRSALGRGSGQESPGFRRLLQLPDEVWPSFEELLRAHDTTLRAVYEDPDAQPDLFALA